MHRIILLITGLLFTFLTYAQDFNKDYGKPLIVLIETDPLAMVLGADVPSFVLYEQGQIIYKVIEDKKLKLFEVTLTKNEIQKVIQSFGITDKIYRLKDNIETVEITDQPSNILTLDLKIKKTINVYGRIDNKEFGQAREKTPKEFLIVYDNLKKYRNSQAKVWMPDKVEIMFWDYNYAPNKRDWIKGFPDLNSPTTIRRGKDSYSVYIDKDKYAEFLKYYKSSGEKEAVLINGRKMSIDYRLPFPNIK